MTIAVYPGTFDPITEGHLDIARRASTIFEELVIGIHDKPEKQVLFSVEERLSMVQYTVRDLPNVRVEAFSGLTIDFIRRVKGEVMVRGLRAISDFERELAMALMNKELAADIELVCLMTSSRYQFLSSSAIKEIAKLGGRVQGMVPDNVAIALGKKFSK
jgi:pantetheine-phosphate adenylyltransferase